MLRYLSFIFLFSSLLQAEAQQTVISGNAISYADTQLIFYRTADWITGSEEIAGECHVSDSGNFSLTIPLETTCQLYTYLGIYKGYFFAEPGRTYHLVLPEKTDKSPEDLLNPYFEWAELHLGSTNFTSEDLNILIVMFDDAYIPYYDKHVNSVYGRSDMKRLEEDINRIEATFRDYPGNYFRAYRQYRYGMLKLLGNQQRVQSISDEYFNNHPVLYNNPAYADLFNMVFDKYFTFFGRTETGKQLYTDINQAESYRALMETLSKSNNFSNDTLRELVILKQLHDEFYGSQFSRNGLLKILDSLSVSTHIAEHRKICNNIRNKLTRLQPGFEPPQFELPDIDGHLVRLTDFRGKYVYLNFCTCQSYTCLNEFNQLAELESKYKDKLTIVTIATDPREEILRQFLAKHQYNWLFLYYDSQPGILKDYDIRAFPTYFLIGPDGKLIYSPALSPSEDFETRLIELWRGRGEL